MKRTAAILSALAILAVPATAPGASDTRTCSFKRYPQYGGHESRDVIVATRNISCRDAIKFAEGTYRAGVIRGGQDGFTHGFRWTFKGYACQKYQTIRGQSWTDLSRCTKGRDRRIGFTRSFR